MKVFVAAARMGLVVTALLASVKLAEAIKETSLHALLQHSAKYHHAKVIVNGTMLQVKVHHQRRGAPSTTFFLTEPAHAASITVSSRGTGTVRDGATVSVEDVFDRTTGKIVAHSIRERR